MTTQKLNRTSFTEDSQAASAAVTGSFPIVGIIGAAGSRQALEKFFRSLPTDTGMAFLVVTRLSAKEQRLLATALEARTDLPVQIVTTNTVLQIDQVYLAPPSVQLTVEQGQVKLQSTSRATALPRLDTFLSSLATDQGANGIAILLSGVGEDGITGLQQVKAQGGLVLVQDPEEAAHPALPRRATAAGVADYVGKAGELAQWLIQRKGDLATIQPPPEQGDERFHQQLTAILNQVATQTGHDLSYYKISTLQRRILRRVSVAGLASLTQYLDLLKSNVAETVALFRDSLVSVTSFFRDPDAYEMLERDCIPQLFRGKGRADVVRVWIAGCATGEEAYSVAIQLTDYAAQVSEPPRLQIFATDLDEEAIAIARRGLYPATIAKQITPQRLQRYFVNENGCYRVKGEIREQVLFAVHDLLQDPPFSRLDLICCRNVLIYFSRAAQEKVFTVFHYALNPNGYLFLGTAESVDAVSNLFAVLNKYCHLYQRQNVTVEPPRRLLGATFSTPLSVPESKISERLAQRIPDKLRTIEEMYATWSLRVHAPPRLLVNQQYDITHLFGGADRYLQARDGAVTQNVLQRIHPDLRLDLRAALYQAFNKRERSISRLLSVPIKQHATMVQLHVGPITELGFPAEYVEVLFVAQESPAFTNPAASTESVATDLAVVSRLEEELLRTRERLQSVIEEYEGSGQELKASNEELQSINEELKSTTEELETSKEELQSMNEELITVNGELTRKIEELHRANSDLLNLIASTEVGAIFLNQQLQISRFTPRAADLFNIIDSDIGRPFTHLTHRLRHNDLVGLAKQVRTTGGQIEETLQRDDNRWFMLRLFPYRTVSGETDGIVLTLIDINDLKRAESEERQRRQQQSLAELSRQALAGSDLDAFLTAATHSVAEVLEMELCKVLQLQPDGKTFLLRAGVGWQAGLVGQALVPVEVSTQAGYTLQSQAPVVVRDLHTETRFRAPRLLVEHEVRSGMSVTIAAVDPATTANTNSAYGVLGVHSPHLRAFTTYDIDYLQAVANLLAATIARRRIEAALRSEEERYRFIFESVGVSIWEEDFTGVKTLLDQLADQGVGDLRAYLQANPAVVAQALAAVQLRNVNAYTLTLFGAESKEQLLTSLARIFTPEAMTVFCEELITLAEGRQYYAAETTLQTLQGERLQVLFAITFPNNAAALDRVLVSIFDITEHKTTEATLQRYGHMLHLSHDAIVIWDEETGIEFWNQGAERLYGYSAAEAIGQKTHRLLATLHPQPVAEIEAHLAQNRSWEGELVHTTKTGDKVVVSTRHQLMINGDGKAVVLEINRDVTTQKQVEAELRESEARFRLLADTAPVLIWVSGLDQGRTFFNKVWLEFTGRTMAQELGAGWTAGIHPDDYERCLTIYTTAFVARQEFEMEYRLRHYDGDYCWVLDKGAPRFAPDGSFAGFIGGCIDITQRKEAETILARYQLLSQQARDIILFMRRDGQIVEANAAAVAAYGYTRTALLQMNLQDLRAPATRHLVMAQMAQADQETNERGLRFETVHCRQDGSTFSVEVSSIGADVGGERLLLSVIRDISERKAVEDALAASEAKFATAFSLSPLILSITSLADGRLLDVNESFIRTTGYTRAEAIGRTPDELGLWVNPQERAAGLAHLAADERVEDVEALFRMKNGELKTCLLGATIVMINGQPCALTALTDITERKQAEFALRQSEERFVTIFQHSPYPIAILSLEERRYVDVNPTWVHDTGYTHAEAVGRTAAELGLQTTPPLHLIDRLQKGELVRDVEIQVQTREGQVRTALVSAELIQLSGKPHILLVFTDITARKRAEERLHFLSETGALLAASLDYNVTLQAVADAAVPTIADWCVIDLLAEDGSFQQGVLAHRDPAKVRWAEELRARYPVDPDAPLGAPQVIRSGQSELYAEITDAMLQAAAKNETELALLRSVGYRSVMIVPLQTHGRTLGAITFVASEQDHHFDIADLAMAEELARRAAAAIGNAQLHQTVQQREQALRISEERLRLATVAGKIGIYDQDLLTNRTIFSDIYYAITGVQQEEVLTRERWLMRVHPDDRALVAEKLQKAVASGESYDYEYRIYRPDGALRWLGVSSQVTIDPTGRPVRLTGAIRDITERKQAEEEIQRLNRDLKRRLDELQSLLDVAPIGIFVAHDPACEVITSNAIGARMLGIQPDTNASKSAPSGDVLPFRVFRNGQELTPDEMPMQIAVQRDESVLNWEIDVVHADGRVVNLYEYAIPLHDEEGKVRGCLGIFVDITERKEAEASLRESEERFRSAFEQAAVGMAHVGLDGHYLRVNERLCAILGYTREELLQKSFLDLIHPEDRATSVALSERLLTNQIPSYSTEKRYLRRDGVMTWVNMTSSVVRDPQGEIKYRLAVIEDIAARKAAEAALRELTATLEARVEARTVELARSNHELDQFAYIASHDLKAPLRAIVNLASWIAEDAGPTLPSVSSEHLNKLRGRTLRMERLLDDLLEYSRIGRRDGLAEAVNTAALLQDVIEMLAPPPGFEVRLSNALPTLFTARAPLELVFRNLLGNAIKHHHAPMQGIVQIDSQDIGDYVEFQLRDNGPGIAPQFHARIFGMFQTLRPRDEVEGSGMGLAIVKKAIEYRGGTIRIESALGAGATFCFTWPKEESKQVE